MSYGEHGEFFLPRPGLNNVGSYLVSGYPWITGSDVPGGDPNNGEVVINFPRVTKNFTIINRTSETLFVHFDTRANVNVIDHRHYISLPNEGDSMGFPMKTKSVYISVSSSAATGSFELYAELTNIAASDMPILSGSGINE